MMRRIGSKCCLLFTLCFAAITVSAQSNYQVITVSNGGTITGTVKWSGPLPRGLDFPVTKDPQICDPESKKRVDLERLEVGSQGGVANTIVYLKNIYSGKAMDLPEQRRHLDQKHCHYIPHILLVPQSKDLQMTKLRRHAAHDSHGRRRDVQPALPVHQSDHLAHHVHAGTGPHTMQRRSCLDERRNDGRVASLLCRHRRKWTL